MYKSSTVKHCVRQDSAGRNKGDWKKEDAQWKSAKEKGFKFSLNDSDWLTGRWRRATSKDKVGMARATTWPSQPPEQHMSIAPRCGFAAQLWYRQSVLLWRSIWPGSGPSCTGDQ